MNGRRKFLLGSLGVIAAGGTGLWFGRNTILRTLATWNDNSSIAMTPAPGFDGDCVLTSQSTEGPFFVRSEMRKDIREDRKGKEMTLRLKFANATDCKPVEGATVEIWHCDADGAYSGYPEDLARDAFGSAVFLLSNSGLSQHIPPTTEKRFLRGAQLTDVDGVCEFTTIIPGWYEGRCPHIHLKAFVGEKDVFSSQIYFNEAFTTRAYTTFEPYKSHGDSPYTRRNDLVIAQSKEGLNGLVLDPLWSESGAVIASAKIGLQLS